MNKATSETYITDTHDTHYDPKVSISGTDGLVTSLRQASKAVYLACDADVADDLSRLMSSAADWINAQGAEMAKAYDKLAVYRGEHMEFSPLA